MALTNAERQARHRERMKEKLRNAAPCEPLRNDTSPDAVLAWLRKVDRDDEERERFLRALRPLIGDWFVPKHWFEDAAYELHLARGTPVPEGLARKKLPLRNGP